MLASVLGGLALLSAAINLWQWLAARRFPLHRRAPRSDFAPGLTLFKPLKGADEKTPGCLESWFAQDYAGPTQILFGVADANDPVCEIVRELIELYPERDVELVVCDPIRGANAKVSTLTYLEAKAKHPFVVISDADVFAPEDLLTDIIQEFQDESAALVNCFYKLPTPATPAMVWESVAVNADFWSQVCQSNSLQPMTFALGAVMCVRREALTQSGGFAPLLSHLADDYCLGNRIFRTVRSEGSKENTPREKVGPPIRLSPIVVECREAPKNFRESWKHQLRWSRTIRVCQPGPYFMSVLSNATFWTLTWVAVAGWTPAARICLLLRVLTAMANHARLTGETQRATEAIFAPIKDLLQFAVWLCAYTGNKVTWRGQTFRVKRGGELRPI
jgi:ceramide glucosyltransferase